ncbi:MAG: hypothetical protein P8J55_06345 [Pseudomonadales bacterium]|nr:hypothetical protein [Pseudomonadales bacterium]
MSILIFTVLALTFSFTLPVQSNTASKEQLLRFARASGIYEQIEEQKVAMQSQGGQAAQQYAQQIKASIPGLPEQFSKDMAAEMEVYMSNLAELIDTKFAVNTYIELISKKLSATEIDKLTAFYESELGIKDTRSNTEIMGEWTTVFMGDLDKKMMVHLQDFVKNLMAKASSYGKQE